MRTALTRAAAILLFGAAPLLAQQSTTAAEYDLAVDLWQSGKYPAALEKLIKVVSAADGAPYFERIALLTGELYRTREITTEGRNPQWSATGRYIAYTTGSAGPGPLRVVDVNDANARIVAELEAGTLFFTPKDSVVMIIRGDTMGTRVFGRTLYGNVARDALLLDDFEFSSLHWAHDVHRTYWVGATTRGATRTEIVIDGLTQGTVAAAITDDSSKSNLIVVPGDRFLVFTVGVAPIVGRGRGGAGAAAGGGRGGGRGGATGSGPSFGVHDLQSGTTKYFTGTAPSIAANGSALVFTSRTISGASVETAINVLALTPGAQPVVVKRTTLPLQSPTMSPSGKRVAFQMQPDKDWEIYAVNADGTNETRVTREIQHDVLPKFIDEAHIVAVQGEPRHRRSFMYDLTTLTRTRLFDNNTVRTIAPEYDWQLSPDRTHLLVVAERDGNTVSPDRGIYVMDLTEKVSPAELLTRLRSNLTAEKSLRALGERAFRPIAADVAARTAEVSTNRIYGYEKALFDFDSKHATQPGNAKARQFLFDRYTSFGYAPVFQEFRASTGGGGGRGGAGQVAPSEARGGVAGNATSALDVGCTGTPTGIPTANVVATLRGTVNPELIYVVGSHFDSRAEGPGADDNTSGTAALLEAARVLAKHPLPATIIFASFTGEESGLRGSTEFVCLAKRNKWRIVGALNNDMLGWANDNRLDNTIRYSNPGIRDVQHAAAFLFTNMITYDALYYKSTDAAAFYDGWGDIVGGIGSYPVLGNPHYHMPHDALEVENHQLIAEASKTTVATLMLLASSPSRITGISAAPTATGATRRLAVTWDPSPEKGIVRYIVRYGPATNPEQFSQTTTVPKVTLPNLEPAAVIKVKAVNAKGLEGWDWAKFVVTEPKPPGAGTP